MCGQAEEKKRKRRRTEKTGRGDRVSPNPRPNPRNSSLCRPCLSEFPYTHCSRLATVTRRQNSSNLSPLSSSLPLAPHPEPSKQGEGRRRKGWVGWADALSTDGSVGGDSLSQLGPVRRRREGGKNPLWLRGGRKESPPPPPPEAAEGFLCREGTEPNSAQGRPQPPPPPLSLRSFVPQTRKNFHTKVEVEWGRKRRGGASLPSPLLLPRGLERASFVRLHNFRSFSLEREKIPRTRNHHHRPSFVWAFLLLLFLLVCSLVGPLAWVG